VERLVFSYGTSRHQGETPSRAAALEQPTPLVAAVAPAADAAPHPERSEWAFIGLMVFTGLLFFRPQDLITPLRMLHLAEISALIALGSLISDRLGRGQAVTRLTPELIGVLAFAFVILATAPFAVWMGGAVGTFTELYAKVVLIFVLMVNTLTSPKRIEQFTWLIVVASGYIATRAVLDYARGVNLIEHGRVQGSVGGMFKNPNDLALNMVAVIPLAAFLVLRPASLLKRGIAALCTVMMLGAVVASQSRSGTVGLFVMSLVLGVQLLKRKPGVVLAFVFAGLLALPLLPSSYWQRVASITNKDLDQTGSREARSVLLRESFEAFASHPLTGVGAGQFKNYNPDGREEAWRESHNVVLQVASELGVVGLAVFFYLVVRAFYAPIQTRRLLRAAAPGRRPSRTGPAPVEPLGDAEYASLGLHSAVLSAALAGWFICALFASVAYHWTFYYLLALAVAPRDYLLARAAAARSGRRAAAARTVATVGAPV
jgi:putative inorganic carbon (hco3(-)) transporter